MNIDLVFIFTVLKALGGIHKKYSLESYRSFKESLAPKPPPPPPADDCFKTPPAATSAAHLATKRGNSDNQQLIIVL